MKSEINTIKEKVKRQFESISGMIKNLTEKINKK